jgi:hypothetical protein
MKRLTITLSISTLLIGSVCALAQDRKPISLDEQQKYVVSAKSGIVNLIEGELSSKHAKTGWASLLEAGRDDWQRLVVGDEIQMDDSVRGGPNTRAEILLTPGIYLRMAGDTEFVFQFDGSSDQTVTLRRGSIIIEAAVDSWILVATPKSDVHLVRAGLYRIDVNNNQLEVAVRDGKAFVGDAEVKEGRKETLATGEPVIAKFDKKSYDLFDTWSKDRAKSLIALNRQLSQRGLKSSGLISLIDNVWIYDRFCGCYTFLPWSSGFSSPYGWDYSVFNPYWSYRTPWYYNRWNGGVGSGASSGGTVNAGGGSTGSGGSGGGGNRHRLPPGSSGGSGRPAGGGNAGGGFHPPSGAPHPSPQPPARMDGGGGRFGSTPSRSAPAPVQNRPTKH